MEAHFRPASRLCAGIDQLYGVIQEVEQPGDFTTLPWPHDSTGATSPFSIASRADPIGACMNVFKVQTGAAFEERLKNICPTEATFRVALDVGFVEETRVVRVPLLGNNLEEENSDRVESG